MIKKWEIELVKIKYTYNPTELEYELKELNKIEVIDLNLRHRIKYYILRDYTGEVEIFGTWVIGENIRRTHLRFSKIDEYEHYIKSIDEAYDSRDAIFNGSTCKIDTPVFNMNIRSQFPESCVFKHKTVECRGISCFIPTKSTLFFFNV